MTEEALIPTMKRIDEKDRKPGIPFLNMALILFCVQ